MDDTFGKGSLNSLPVFDGCWLLFDVDIEKIG